MSNITEPSIRESHDPYVYYDDKTSIIGADLALKGADLCCDVITGILLPHVCSPDLKTTVATLPSLSQYRDYALQDLYRLYLPATNEINAEDETSSVEPVTPTSIQESGCHYAGIAHAATGLGGAVSKPNIEMNIHFSRDQAPSWTSEEVCEDDSSVPEAIQSSKRLDGTKIAPVENPDSAKLQRLIYLQLHCAAEVGAEQQKKNDDITVGDRIVSQASTPTDEDDADSKVEFGDCCPRGVISVAFSHGSVGHPDTCAEPCKYFRKKRGCMDGLACSHCHLCDWKPQRTQRGRRGRKSRSVSELTDGDSGNLLDLYMDTMVEGGFASSFQGKAVRNGSDQEMLDAKTFTAPPGLESAFSGKGTKYKLESKRM